MNLRGGFALMRYTWSSWLQYRSFFFILAFGWMITPLVSLFVWRSAAGESGYLAGLSASEYTAYYLILILVNQLTYAQANWTLGDVIRTGGLNAWLLRPVAPIFNILSSELAGKLVYSIFTIPAAAGLAFLLQPDLHTDPYHLAAFFLCLAMAWAVRFLWGISLAMFAFWFVRADSLLALQDTLIFLLGGLVAPVFLLPTFLQSAAFFLPFRYMLGFPVEVLMSKTSITDLLPGIYIQSVWVGISGGLAWLIWHFGQKHYTAVGG